ncbi:hypothetical protein C0033_07820 [Clostridium sp. chh4-2]|nr:hypothetical protein C0033_07820 [Clostridium sp. chh4-2]
MMCEESTFRFVFFYWRRGILDAFAKIIQLTKLVKQRLITAIKSLMVRKAAASFTIPPLLL